MAFFVPAAGFTFEGHLSNWTICLERGVLKVSTLEYALANCSLFCSNALSWFFLIYMNKRHKGTRLLSGHLLSD